MYQEHQLFRINNTLNTPYWRYMDFWKFLNLVNTSSLFFPNVEMLGDQHEGRIPEKIYRMMLEEENDFERKNNFAKDYKNFVENDLRKRTLILSMTANKNESFAMWKMYAKDKLGIAIKTNFERLKKTFSQCDETIYIGEVNYYDDENPSYVVGNTYSTFLTKHNYYEFESEVRCITDIKNGDNSTFKNISINLNDLIEEVYLSPFAYDNGLAEITQYLKEKNKLNFKISISGVKDKWI